eukprot:6177640-Pleurochrysis_carterae.AAC.2
MLPYSLLVTDVTPPLVSCALASRICLHATASEERALSLFLQLRLPTPHASHAAPSALLQRLHPLHDSCANDLRVLCAPHRREHALALMCVQLR